MTPDDFTTNQSDPIPLFIQIFDDNEHCVGMVADNEERHRAYCAKWGYEYRAHQVTAPVNLYWFRIEVVAEYMKTGRYSHIFQIDTDAMVVDFSHDMRETLPDDAFLGLAIHPIPHDGREVWHFNAGCFYIQCTPLADLFFAEVLSYKDVAPHDQGVMNEMLMTRWEYQSKFNVLSRVWNNSVHDQPNDNMIVAAWHGASDHKERRAWMAETAEEYPYEP
jgi:hypothetical protein